MDAARILVCDDDPHIRRTLEVLLGDAGFEVIVAGTVEEALDRAALREPHMAIVDLLLPDGDGVEVCRRLREWSDMPVLILSAVGEEQSKIDALNQGADDYLVKPFGRGELLARVEAALRRASPEPAPSRVQAGGLLVDLGARAVWVGGEEVRLTPIEFALLRLLVVNRGRLMTHRQLLSEVWGPGHADATPLLRTHMSNLRTKLTAAAGEPPPIRTDSGIGYRFSA